MVRTTYLILVVFFFFGLRDIAVATREPSDHYYSRCAQNLRRADVDASGSLTETEFRAVVRFVLNEHYPYGQHERCLEEDSAVESIRNEYQRLTSSHFFSACDSSAGSHSETLAISTVNNEEGTKNSSLEEICIRIEELTEHLVLSCSDTSNHLAMGRSLQHTASCERDAHLADEDGSKDLSESEYVMFAEYRLGCPGKVQTSFVLPSLWSSAHCLCESDLSSLCCDETVDIRSTNSQEYWFELCESIDAIAIFIRRGPGCTAAPPITFTPTAQPSTYAPSPEPTNEQQVITNYSPTFFSCLSDLRAADENTDEELNFAEFVSLHACDRSEVVDPSVFSSLARGSRSISIRNAYSTSTTWDLIQQERFLEICNANVCRTAPLSSRCESQLLMADQNGDGQLSEAEYYVYLDLVTECRNPPEMVAFSLFETARCVCKEFTDDIFCCLLGDTIDINNPTDQAYIDRICELSSTILFVVDGDAGCSPTERPITLQPTGYPVPAPTSSPSVPPTNMPVTTELPVVTEGPTSAMVVGEPDCIDELLSADLDRDRELNSDEYWLLLASLAGCDTALPQVPVDIGFRSTICTSCVLMLPASCCLTNSGIDLSALYDNPDAFVSISYAALICTANQVAIQVLEGDGCPIAPSVAPTASPDTSSPDSANQPEQSMLPTPTSYSLQPKTFEPDRQPSVDPTSEQQVPEPTLSPSEVTASPTVTLAPKPFSDPFVEQFLVETENCIKDMLGADDGNDFLRPQEFLNFIVRLSGCSLITELSRVQSDLFREFACLCLEDPSRFTQQCCNRQNAAINIEGARKQRSSRSMKEMKALQSICDRTRSLIPETCAPPPTPAPTDGPLTSSPVLLPQIDTKPQSLPLHTPLPTTGDLSPVLTDQSETSVPTNAVSPPASKESEFCLLLYQADTNNDGFLDEGEFLQFLRSFSKCSLDAGLTFKELVLFGSQTCDCSGAGYYDVLCCRGDPKVPLSEPGWPDRVSIGNSSNRANVCAHVTQALHSACLPSVTGLSPEELEFQTCTAELANVDDGDDEIEEAEYARFIQAFRGCDWPVNKTDFAVTAVFLALSCSETGPSGYYPGECLRNPKINVSGLRLLRTTRSPEQNTRLLQICSSSSVLADRKCILPPNLSKEPTDEDCLATLKAVDNGDGMLSMEEFSAFLHQRNPGCSVHAKPTAAQKAVFSIISCSCVFVTYNPYCCLNGEGRIELDGVLTHGGKDSPEQLAFLSVICRASSATSFGCKKKTLSPFPLPQQHSSSGSPQVQRSFAAPFTVIAVVAFFLLHCF